MRYGVPAYQFWKRAQCHERQAGSDQQQTFFRGIVTGAGSFSLATPIASEATGMSEGLRESQDLWQSSMENWLDIAKQALPQAAVTSESLKPLFDPGQWAQGGSLDSAIEHLVDGPSYADGGVGVFVSGNSQGVLGQSIVDWLRERQ